MNYLTPIIAIIGCLLVASRKPIYGLCTYLVISIWYPYGLGTVSLGSIDFSAGRIVILLLFFKIFFGTKLVNNFKFVWLDRFVIILFIAEIVAGLTTIPAIDLIENRAGDFFDMALPYFAVRLVVTDRDKLLILLKTIAWSSSVLAIFGIHESLTGENLLAFGRILSKPELRLNLYRAQTTLRNSIYYGVYSAMAGALTIGLLKSIVANKKKIYKILIFLCFLGCFSAMSSGGLLAMVGSLAFIAFFNYRHSWKNALVVIVIMCLMVEIISNRHFYDVIDRICFNSATAWYRARLFEVAFFEGGMKGHWFFGYGFEDPGWGMKINMLPFTDMVNLKLCRYGLIGFIPFSAVIILAINYLLDVFRRITNVGDQWIVWCVAASLLGVLLTMNSVSLFGMPMTLLFMVFGICGSVQLLFTDLVIK